MQPRVVSGERAHVVQVTADDEYAYVVYTDVVDVRTGRGYRAPTRR